MLRVVCGVLLAAFLCPTTFLLGSCTATERSKTTAQKRPIAAENPSLEENACLLASSTAELFYNNLHPKLRDVPELLQVSEQRQIPEQQWETGTTLRAGVVDVPFVEVPIELLEPAVGGSEEPAKGEKPKIIGYDFADELIKNSLVTKAPDSEHGTVKWFFHPLQSPAARARIIENLKERARREAGCSASDFQERTWKGLLTASRSVIVQAGPGGVVFSVKTPFSLVENLLLLEDSAEAYDALSQMKGHQAVCASQHVARVLETWSPEHAEILLDVLGYTLRFADRNQEVVHTQVVREYPEWLTRCDPKEPITALPTFATGITVNDNPLDVSWLTRLSVEDLLEQDALSAAEQIVLFGLQPKWGSNHTQNRLQVAVSEANRPFPLVVDDNASWTLTGRQLQRDVSDTQWVQGFSPSIQELQIQYESCKGADFQMLTRSEFDQGGELILRVEPLADWVSVGRELGTDQGDVIYKDLVRRKWRPAFETRFGDLAGFDAAGYSKLPPDGRLDALLLFLDGAREAVAGNRRCIGGDFAFCSSELEKLYKGGT